MTITDELRARLFLLCATEPPARAVYDYVAVHGLLTRHLESAVPLPRPPSGPRSPGSRRGSSTTSGQSTTETPRC